METLSGTISTEKPEKPMAADHMPRSRIDQLLEKATQSKLVYVIAGAGYGKTQAVRHYIEQQTDAIVRWVQLTESDNIGLRYWDNLTHNIFYDNPELSAKLRDLGFPETPTRFKQFAEIIKSTEHRTYKTFLVLDDFHMIKSEQALTFAERCAYLQMPGACVLIISRQEPEINAVPLFAKGQVSIITEDELRYTDNEIAEIFKQRNIQISGQNLPRLIGATKGWALAIQLLLLVLQRMPKNFDLALDTMKQNIYKLMEVEAFKDFPEDIQKLLVKLSLVSNLPLTILQEFNEGASVLNEAPQLRSFVWFDSFSGETRVHPLYWEFLQSKHGILTDEEKRETYRQSAQWCYENNFGMDAMYYYAKSQEYKSVIEILFSYPVKLPHDTCEYLFGIIKSLEQGEGDKDDKYFLALKNFFMPLMLTGMRRYEEAKEICFEIISKWEHMDTPIANRLLCASYSNLAYIDMYNCTVTHKYDAPTYIKKAAEHFERSKMPPTNFSGAFSVADIRSLSCLVGVGASLSEFDQFLEASKQAVLSIAETQHSMYYGYDDLVSCELAFYKNQPDEAKTHAYGAIMKAREKKQYSIEAMATQYLLRISMQEGDYPLAKEALKRLQANLDNPDFWNRQLLFDLFTGLFYAQIGLPDLVPSWLNMDDTEVTSEVRIPARELVVCVKRYIASKKYDQALAALYSTYPREPQERFLLSELVLLLMTAVARVQTGDASKAVEDLKDAYELSFEGVFEMPFIELGKNLHPLVTAALNQGDCGVPIEWLKAIVRKASIYAKKTAVITNSFKGERQIKDAVQLSQREKEVLNDLYHGLSRDEIAANRYLSVNTVKKILQSIYIKLDATNNIDAIRIAIEEKLID